MIHTIKLLLSCFVVSLATSGCFLMPRNTTSPPDKKAQSLVDSGVEFLRVEELEQAEAAFTAAYEISATANALDGLGCVEFRRGAVSEAREYFVAANKLDPRYAPALHHLALVNEREGRPVLALQFFEEALKLDPANPSIRNDYGAYLRDSGRAEADVSKQQLASSLFRQATILGDVGLALRNLEE